MDEILPERRLHITDEAIAHLDSLSKWTMFLAIMGFIGSGLLVVLGLFFAIVMRALGASHEFGSMVPALLGIFYVILGVAYFVPSYFLLRFSGNTKAALSSGDEESLTAAIKYLRTFFIFIGISVIAIIALYILLIIGAILFGMFAAIHGGAQSRV